jgi:hypothetical protein
MLTAICLDDQSCAKMHEIRHVSANRLLAPELFAIQPMCPQVPPQRVLALGHMLPQVFGEFALFHYPPPSPQPLSR